MNREWTTHKVRQIEVDRRNIKMQAAQAIRGVLDALVELITNSDDAYAQIGNKKGKIIIEVARERGKRAGVITVKDRAGGMTLDEMESKIIKYGGFYAGKHARGYMGRGAKDIVALGYATFESIKDECFNRIELDSEFEANIKKSVRPNKEDYKILGLRQGKGGMTVTLEVDKRHKLPQHDTLVRELQSHYALRDILQHREVRLIHKRTRKQSVLRYTNPEGELFYEDDLLFEAPYEQARAKLRLFKAPQDLPSDSQEGIIVTDGRAIHQVTRFAPDLEEDAIARQFFGRLECSYIRDIQLEFEKRRSAGEEQLEHNPVDIVDPNRRRGLDRNNHPFVMKLFDWAENILRTVVAEVREEKGDTEKKVANEQTRKRLKSLSEAVAEHLKSRVEEETLSPRTPEQEAALQNEGVLLNPQFNRMERGETRRLGYTVISFGPVDDPDHVSVILNGDRLQVNPTEPKLRPQRRMPDRLTAYFEVTALGPAGEAEFTVSHPNELISPVTRKLEITEPRDPYAEVQYGLFFKNQNYTVHNNGVRTLTFLARGRRFRGVTWEDKNLIQSSKPEVVPILRGNALSVEEVSKDIWKGEAQVRGHGVGKASIVSLSIVAKEGLETANTRVKVVAKDEPAKVSIDISLVPEKGGQLRAAWDRDNPNLLKVYAEHTTLSRYLGSYEEDYPGQKLPHFKVLLAEIVADKVAQRVLQARVDANPRLFVDTNNFFFLYSAEMTAFLPVAHKIMISDADVARLKAD